MSGLFLSVVLIKSLQRCIRGQQVETWGNTVGRNAFYYEMLKNWAGIAALGWRDTLREDLIGGCGFWWGVTATFWLGVNCGCLTLPCLFLGEACVIFGKVFAWQSVWAWGRFNIPLPSPRNSLFDIEIFGWSLWYAWVTIGNRVYMQFFFCILCIFFLFRLVVNIMEILYFTIHYDVFLAILNSNKHINSH